MLVAVGVLVGVCVGVGVLVGVFVGVGVGTSTGTESVCWVPPLPKYVTVRESPVCTHTLPSPEASAA